MDQGFADNHANGNVGWLDGDVVFTYDNDRSVLMRFMVAKAKSEVSVGSSLKHWYVKLAVTAGLALISEVQATAQNVQPARTFGQEVRKFYSDAIDGELVPEVTITNGELRYELPRPSSFDPMQAEPLEVAAIEQARVEAIKRHRMDTENRRRNWNTVLPVVENEIARILAIDKQQAGRPATAEQIQAAGQLSDRIDQLYKQFFNDVATRSNLRLNTERAVEAYPVAIYAVPDGAQVSEIDRGTFLIHQHYNRPIPWKPVSIGGFGHFSYGRVVLKAQWPDSTGFAAKEWTYTKGRVVEVRSSGPRDAGPDDQYQRPATETFIP